MIIWLNGAFGAGKTQTANEIFKTYIDTESKSINSVTLN